MSSLLCKTYLTGSSLPVIFLSEKEKVMNRIGHLKQYVAIEGGEYVGKTSLLEGLKETLGQAVFLREPGSTPVGEKLRTLVREEVEDQHTSMYLFLAQRRLITAMLEDPAMAGKTVITDRSLLTSVVYQDLIGDENGFADLTAEVIYGIHSQARLFIPNKVIYLTASDDTLLARQRARGIETDILGSFAWKNRKAIDKGYRTFFKNHPEFDVLYLDNSNLTQEQTLQKALDFISN